MVQIRYANYGTKRIDVYESCRASDVEQLFGILAPIPHGAHIGRGEPILAAVAEGKDTPIPYDINEKHGRIYWGTFGTIERKGWLAFNSLRQIRRTNLPEESTSFLNWNFATLVSGTPTEILIRSERHIIYLGPEAIVNGMERLERGKLVRAMCAVNFSLDQWKNVNLNYIQDREHPFFKS